MIIDCIPQPLFATEISLGRLYADVTKQELNLLQLASGQMAQSCARAPQIMRRHIRQAAR